jgi:hypothetical protein
LPDNVKVLIAERNGVDLEYSEELDLLADNIPFDEPGFVADNVSDAIIETGDAVADLVVTISLIQNGTLSGGTFLGYSNLLPGDSTPVVSPINGVFVGFTWSNKKTTCDFALEFRLDSTVATPFFTWSVDNTQTAEIDLVVAEAVTAGQTFFIKYIDEGTNAADAAIVLKFKS